MEEHPTVGKRIVYWQTERDRKAEQLQAEAYQHLVGRLTNLLPRKIDLDLASIAHKEVTQ